MSCSWNYEHYRSCLLQAQEQGYVIVPFQEVENINKNQPFLILRHDLERSVSRALAMARLENSMGLRATYFVRVHAPTYNIFTYNTYKALKEMQSYGHELGLHFETLDFSQITGEKPREVFLREKKVLETVLDSAVMSAAAHGEHTSVGLEHNRSFFDTISKEEVGIHNDAYDPAFTKEIKYLSDSFGFWREGCLCKHLGQYPRMQVLIHPCWWFKDNLFE